MDKVEQAVLSEAQASAARILEEARRMQEKIVSAWRADCDEAYRQAAADAAAAASRETARQASSARHRGRMKVLAAKNEILNDVFRRAAEQLRAMPDDVYMETMRAWLVALPADAGGLLRVDRRDQARFSADFLARANASRSGAGTFTGVAADTGIDGGFVVEGESFTIDQTIDRGINDLRESMAGELAADLFGGQA